MGVRCSADPDWEKNRPGHSRPSSQFLQWLGPPHCNAKRHYATKGTTLQRGTTMINVPLPPTVQPLKHSAPQQSQPPHHSASPHSPCPLHSPTSSSATLPADRESQERRHRHGQTVGGERQLRPASGPSGPQPPPDVPSGHKQAAPTRTCCFGPPGKCQCALWLVQAWCSVVHRKTGKA